MYFVCFAIFFRVSLFAWIRAMPRTGPGRPKKTPKPTARMKIPIVQHLLNDGLGIMEACATVAEENDFSANAMYHAFKAHKDEPDIKHSGNSCLTEAQELSIACVIIAFDLVGAALSQDVLTGMVKDVFKKEVHPSWWTSYYARHETRLAGRRKRGAVGINDHDEFRAEVRRWGGKIDKFLNEHHFPAHCQINPDETRLYEKDGAVYLTRMGARHRTSSTIDKDGETSVGTYIPFPAADGSMIMSVYVLRAKFNHGEEAEGSFYLPHYSVRQSRTLHPWPIYFIYTQSGWLTKATWRKILWLFAETWELHHPGLQCCLWLDYAGIHYQPDLVLELAAKGIFTVFFPVRTTKFLQPADQRLFALLKLLTIKILADKRTTIALLGGSWSGALWQACFRAELRTFRPPVIKGSFSDAGIFPWNEPNYKRL